MVSFFMIKNWPRSKKIDKKKDENLEQLENVATLTWLFFFFQKKKFNNLLYFDDTNI